MAIIYSNNRWSSYWFLIFSMEEYKEGAQEMTIRCTMCKFELDSRYLKYRDTTGNPYCQNCYVIIGGQI